MQPILKITPVLFLVILILSSLDSITAYIYLPSMPAIAKSFNVGDNIVQLTLSVFFLGVGLSHLVYGPLSDRYGRRNPLLFGITFSLAGTILCFHTETVDLFLLGRFMEGIGVGACHAIGRAVARDLLSGNKLAKFISQIGMAITVMSAAAVAFGGVVQSFFGWRMNFLILTFYSLFTLIFVYRSLPETNRHIDVNAMKPKHLISNYLFVLKNKTFLGFVICANCANMGIGIYNVSVPFILQNIVGLTSAQFGSLSLLILVAVCASAFCNQLLVEKKGINTMLLYGIILLFISGTLMLFFALLGYINTFVIMFPVTIYMFGLGFVLINANAGGFHPFPHLAGITSALYGSIAMLSNSLSSSIMSLFTTKNQIPLASMLVVLSILTFLSYLLIRDYNLSEDIV